MFKRLLKFIPVLILMALALAACREQEPLAFQATALKQDVDIRSIYSDGAITFLIYNPSGIGDAKITLSQGRMPQKVRVRLFVQGLENLELSYDNVKIIASVATQNNGPVIERLAKAGEEIEINESSPYWIEIEALPAKEGGIFFGMPALPSSFLITLPDDFYDSHATEFALSWVDFYR